MADGTGRTEIIERWVSFVYTYSCSTLDTVHRVCWTRAKFLHRAHLGTRFSSYLPGAENRYGTRRVTYRWRPGPGRAVDEPCGAEIRYTERWPQNDSESDRTVSCRVLSHDHSKAKAPHGQQSWWAPNLLGMQG